MSDVVFLSGDFCSGSTLLFTLFRETGEYYCLYEPLHQLLREYLIWPLRVYEHHYFVKDYFKEYKGFKGIEKRFNPARATRNLHLTAEDRADDLYEYLDFIIRSASQRSEKVLLKFNRMSFRLPWLRARFLQAKIVHIHRDKESQWKSIVARGQDARGRTDIGQNRPDFEGFQIAARCEDLKTTFPELAIENSSTGFERFSKLYDRSLAAHLVHSHLSLEYRSLCKDFETNCSLMFEVVGCSADVNRLKPLIILPESQRRKAIRPTGSLRAPVILDRIGRKYARARVGWSDKRKPAPLGPPETQVKV